MKQIVIKDLELDEDYENSLHLSGEEEVVCSKFIKHFFGFTKLPKEIKKLCFVRSDKGLFDLYRERKIYGRIVYWNCGLPKSYDVNNFYKEYFYTTYDLSERLLKLFKKDQDKIRVDVYIEGWR
jgi:hypothetical protein